MFRVIILGFPPDVYPSTGEDVCTVLTVHAVAICEVNTYYDTTNFA